MTRAVVNIIKKIVLLGDPAVGKTSLIQRYVLNEFSDDYIPTIGTKVTKKTLPMEFEPKRPQSIALSMLIFDVLGQLKYHDMQRPYFQGAEGALIICDLSRAETIRSLREWNQQLARVVGTVPIIYIGNKKDLIDKDHENKELLGAIAAEKDLTYLTTSARTSDNVERAFEMLARKIIDTNPL